MNQHWKTETDGAGVAWLCIDKADAGANVLSSDVMRELDTILKSYEADPPRGVVLYSGKPGSFIMGADINEFTQIKDPELPAGGEVLFYLNRPFQPLAGSWGQRSSGVERRLPCAL